MREVYNLRTQNHQANLNACFGGILVAFLVYVGVFGATRRVAKSIHHCNSVMEGCDLLDPLW